MKQPDTAPTDSATPIPETIVTPGDQASEMQLLQRLSRQELNIWEPEYCERAQKLFDSIENLEEVLDSALERITNSPQFREEEIYFIQTVTNGLALGSTRMEEYVASKLNFRVGNKTEYTRKARFLNILSSVMFDNNTVPRSFPWVAKLRTQIENTITSKSGSILLHMLLYAILQKRADNDTWSEIDTSVYSSRFGTTAINEGLFDRKPYLICQNQYGFDIGARSLGHMFAQDTEMPKGLYISNPSDYEAISAIVNKDELSNEDYRTLRPYFHLIKESDVLVASNSDEVFSESNSDGATYDFRSIMQQPIRSFVVHMIMSDLSAFKRPSETYTLFDFLKYFDMRTYSLLYRDLQTAEDKGCKESFLRAFMSIQISGQDGFMVLQSIISHYGLEFNDPSDLKNIFETSDNYLDSIYAVTDQATELGIDIETTQKIQKKLLKIYAEFLQSLVTHNIHTSNIQTDSLQKLLEQFNPQIKSSVAFFQNLLHTHKENITEYMNMNFEHTEARAMPEANRNEVIDLYERDRRGSLSTERAEPDIVAFRELMNDTTGAVEVHTYYTRDSHKLGGFLVTKKSPDNVVWVYGLTAHSGLSGIGLPIAFFEPLIKQLNQQHTIRGWVYNDNTNALNFYTSRIGATPTGDTMPNSPDKLILESIQRGTTTTL